MDTVMLDNGDVMCITKHLTSFAILLSTTGTVTRSDPEKYALKYVSYIGCGISIVCLVLTLIVLAILRYVLCISIGTGSRGATGGMCPPGFLERGHHAVRKCTT